MSDTTVRSEPVSGQSERARNSSAAHGEMGSGAGSSPLSRILDVRDEKLAEVERWLTDLGGDISEPEIEAKLDAALADADVPLKDKLERYRAVFRSLEASATFRRSEAQVRLDAAKRDEANMDRMKARLRYYFEQHGLERVDLPSGGRVALVANGGKVPVILNTPVDDLPAWAQRLTLSADLEAIRQQLESGAGCGFAELGDRGRSVRIK